MQVRFLSGLLLLTGCDRANFGRNSKLLYGWAHAMINIAPLAKDDNNLLGIGSGKCSNAREFAPFAIRLNERMMLYERDDSVDVEALLENVQTPKAWRKATGKTHSADCNGARWSLN
jgi:hypothetical protein